MLIRRVIEFNGARVNPRRADNKRRGVTAGCNQQPIGIGRLRATSFFLPSSLRSVQV